MADPKLEIEKRMDRVEEALGVIAQIALSGDDIVEIEKILRGEKSEESEDKSELS